MSAPLYGQSPTLPTLPPTPEPPLIEPAPLSPPTGAPAPPQPLAPAPPSAEAQVANSLAGDAQSLDSPPGLAPMVAPAPSLLPREPAAVPLAPAEPDATPVVRPRDLAKEPPLPSIELTGGDQAALAGLGDEPTRERPVVPLEPTRFHGLQPGRSSASDVMETLGEPLQRSLAKADDPEAAEPTESIWVYEVAPFPRVEMTLRKNIVQSIFVKVPDLPEPGVVAKQLQIDSFQPGYVLDQGGEPIGVTYPERGVILSLRKAPGATEAGVFSILLEPISSELFVLRARNARPEHCTQRLDDLETALRLRPNNAEACGLKARILASIGETRDALKLTEDALRADPDGLEWRLLAARLRGQLGGLDVAKREVESMLHEGENDADADAEWPAVLHAEAELLLGDLLAREAKPDEALPHHRKAIELASPFREVPANEVRRAALRVLANAHLAVANDIAWGNWRRKAEVVPQWVKAGHHLADQLISNEDEESVLAQRVQRLTLSAYAGFAEWVDPSQISREALQQGMELIAAAKDPLHRRRLEWELAETMYYAMLAERQRGAYATAVEFAKVSSPLLLAARRQRELTPRELYLLGELHFLAGSCLAIEAERHEDAVRWYEKGAIVLLDPFPEGVVESPAELGDQLVSMGVSYWRTKASEKAIQLTLRGVQLLQSDGAGEAVQASLRIAYGNLAAMLRAAGREDEAVRWDERLSSLPRSSR
ncbi:MAG: hypothetical protein KDB14_00720 [Planctomycetales bacterium]|nr:hypothetical protein [Planctomycetales bacterium]